MKTSIENNAYNLWYNGIDFKEYLKIVTNQGSIISDVCNLEEYHQQCRIAAEEHEASYGEFAGPYGYIE